MHNILCIAKVSVSHTSVSRQSLMADSDAESGWATSPSASPDRIRGPAPTRLDTLPDELIALVLLSCDLTALRTVNAVSSRMRLLARRTLQAEEEWWASSANRNELRAAMWSEGSYTVRELPRADKADRAIRAISLRGDRLAWGCGLSNRKGVMHLWELGAADREVLSLEHTWPVTSVALRDDGFVATACFRHVHVWSVGTEACDCRSGIGGNTGTVTGLAWAGEHLVSSAMDGSLCVWDGVERSQQADGGGDDGDGDGAELERLLRMGLPGGLRAPVYSLAAVDSDAVASGGSDRTVSLWSLSRGQCRQQFVGHRGAVQAVVACDELGLIASASLPRSLRLWDRRSGACTAQLTGCMLRPEGEDDSTCSLACDGLVLASTCSEGVRLWDLRHVKRALADLADESDQVGAIAASGGRLCAGSDIGAVRVWEQLRR